MTQHFQNTIAILYKLFIESSIAILLLFWSKSILNKVIL
jgi:hypothetical protein